jgi:hypothetical protein
MKKAAVYKTGLEESAVTGPAPLRQTTENVV